jgi:hypothetical protein
VGPNIVLTYSCLVEEGTEVFRNLPVSGRPPCLPEPWADAISLPGGEGFRLRLWPRLAPEFRTECDVALHAVSGKDFC